MAEPDARVVSDLVHAIRTPLAIAARRLARVLREGTASDDLRAAHAALQKCVRAVDNAQVFAHLATDNDISAKSTQIGAEDLVRILRDVAHDYAALYADSIRLRVEAPERLDTTVRVDVNLFELAVANVIENACKFSYSGTTVLVRAELTPRQFRVDVLNEGIPILPDEVQQIFKRGWSSEAAKAVTSSGSGLGLWIADAVTRAQGAEISVIATDAAGQTVVRLNFPVERGGEIDGNRSR